MHAAWKVFFMPVYICLLKCIFRSLSKQNSPMLMAFFNMCISLIKRFYQYFKKLYKHYYNIPYYALNNLYLFLILLKIKLST